jgi:hypothetical protein
MSNTTELRSLAKRIFDLTRREIWLGGKVKHRHDPGPNWPKGLERVDWSPGLTWTLSPEIELAGIKLRVCISWRGGVGHGVRVFADGELKYPGGYYDGVNSSGILFTHRDAWSWKIAQIENADGGRKGRISARRELLAAADEAEKTVRRHNPQPGDDILCSRCEEIVGTVVAEDP